MDTFKWIVLGVSVWIILVTIVWAICKAGSDEDDWFGRG